MSSNLPKAMEYVADVVRNADVHEGRDRAPARADHRRAAGRPRRSRASLAGFVASRADLRRRAVRPQPRRHAGSRSQKIKRDDIVAVSRDVLPSRQRGARAGGDIEGGEAFALAQKQFGIVEAARRGSKPRRGGEGAAVAPRVVVVDMPDAGQAAVVVGARRASAAADPAYIAALVTNSVLGGGYSSRLNQEIRIKRGLSYGAGSSFEPRARRRPVHRAHADEERVGRGSRGDHRRRDESPRRRRTSPDAELTPRKAALIGDFAQSLETTQRHRQPRLRARAVRPAARARSTATSAACRP